VVDVVKDVLVVYVYVVLQYVGEVKTMLTVSTIVELAVGQDAFVAVVTLQDATGVRVTIGMDPLNVVVTDEDVVTAELIEYTVVDTVGPSGCLILPILRPAYSVNHTFTVPLGSV